MGGKRPGSSTVTKFKMDVIWVDEYSPSATRWCDPQHPMLTAGRVFIPGSRTGKGWLKGSWLTQQGTCPHQAKRASCQLLKCKINFYIQMSIMNHFYDLESVS